MSYPLHKQINRYINRQKRNLLACQSLWLSKLPACKFSRDQLRYSWTVLLLSMCICAFHVVQPKKTKLHNVNWAWFLLILNATHAYRLHQMHRRHSWTEIPWSYRFSRRMSTQAHMQDRCARWKYIARCMAWPVFNYNRITCWSWNWYNVHNKHRTTTKRRLKLLAFSFMSFQLTMAV